MIEKPEDMSFDHKGGNKYHAHQRQVKPALVVNGQEIMVDSLAKIMAGRWKCLETAVIIRAV